jgi:hypothetical protein
VWPQCWDLQEPRGLEQRDLRNLNLGDLKKGPKGGVSPTPQKKTVREKMCLQQDEAPALYIYTKMIESDVSEEMDWKLRVAHGLLSRRIYSSSI